MINFGYLIFFNLLGCTSEAACEASKNRLQSIKDQRLILLELHKIDRLGKKKFRAVDEILSDEETLEFQKMKNRCKNEYP